MSVTLKQRRAQTTRANHVRARAKAYYAALDVYLTRNPRDPFYVIDGGDETDFGVLLIAAVSSRAPAEVLRDLAAKARVLWPEDKES